jgi:uncharacterized protein YfaS (alpha-2-macroglobulin family)
MEELRVLRGSPVGATPAVPQVVAMFNQPMTRLGDYANVPSGILKIEPPLAGEYRWLNQYTLAFVPSEPLALGQNYRATVSAGIKSLADKSLAEDYVFNFRRPALEVRYSEDETSRYPGDALRPKINMWLNQSVAVEELQGLGQFVYSEDGAVKKVPAKWESRAHGGWSYRGRSSVVAEASADIPPHTSYALVLEDFPLWREGQEEPELGEVTLFTGSTYGPLEIFPPRDRSDALPEEYDFYVPYPMGPYLSFSFSNLVPAAENIHLIEMDPPYQGLLDLQKRYAKPQADAASAATAPAAETAAAAVPAGAEDAGAEDEDVDVDVDVEEELPKVLSGLYLYARLWADATYTVTFKAGFTDVFGQKLTEDKTFTFLTSSYPTFASFEDRGGIMEKEGPLLTPLRMTNIRETEVWGYLFSEEEAVELILGTDFSLGGRYSYFYRDNVSEALGSAPPQGKMTVRTEADLKKASGLVPVDLAKLFPERPLGLVFLLANPGGDASYNLSQVTDIGLAVKLGRENSLAWITSLSTGRNRVGATARLWSGSRVVWEGVTDGSGLVVLPGIEELRASEDLDGRLLLSARDGDDYVLWDPNDLDGFYSYQLNLDWGAMESPFAQEKKASWLLASQPIYKIGDWIRLKIIARTEAGDQLVDLEEKQARALLVDVHGNVVYDETLEVGPYGSVSVEYFLEEDATYGPYRVYLDKKPSDKKRASDIAQSYGDGPDIEIVGSVDVRFYRVPSLEARFDSFPKEATVGDKIDMTMAANYHYGSPVVGQKASYRVESRALWGFSLPGQEAYSVVNSFFPESDESPEGEFFFGGRLEASGEADLNFDGRLPISFTVASPPYPFPTLMEATGTVVDLDSREISHARSFVAHPASLYAGLKTSNYLANAGESVRGDLIVADPAGALKGGKEVTLSFYRRFWTTARRRSTGGTYDYVSRYNDELVGQKTVTSEGAPVSFEFTPEKPGSHFVKASVKDDLGRVNEASISFYVFGDGGSAGWNFNNDDTLNLIPDKAEYAPGDVARILVQSPFLEGTGLLTVERAGIRQKSTFPIMSQSPVLEIPIGEADYPNIFVSVILTRGRVEAALKPGQVDLGKPTFRVGYLQLKVPSPKDILTVSVKADRAEYRPGEEATLELSVADYKGEAFSDARVALVVVDAALIQLGGDESFHPETSFHAPRRLMVSSSANLGAIIGRRFWADKGGDAAPAGGGGFLAADENLTRSDFRAAPYFAAETELDSEGRARATFKLPDNLTTFKVYAVATGHGRLTGTGESSFLVTKDLLLRSSLPNQATVGDEFSAAVIVTNRGKNQGEARVEFASANLRLEGGEAAQSVSVPPGESREVFFKVKAETPGEAEISFAATMGQDSDKVLWVLSVRDANPLTTQASFAELKGAPLDPDASAPDGPESGAAPPPDGVGVFREEGRMELVGLPPGTDMTRGQISLSLSPTLLTNIADPLDWLRNYPFNCVEQSTSKAWGELSRLKIADRLGLAPEERADSEARVRSQIVRLQNWSLGGGFASWPGGGYENRSAFLTAHVLDFLNDARDQGFIDGSDSFYMSVVDFLQSEVLRADRSSPFLARFDEATRDALILAVARAVSQAGEPQEALMEVYFEKREKLDFMSLVNLARAVAAQPASKTRTAWLMDLIPLVTNKISISAGNAQIAGDYFSPLLWLYGNRDLTPLALLALCEAAPYNELLPYLARGVVDATAAFDRYSTYRASTLAKALVAYALLKEGAENPDIEATLSWGGKDILEGTFKSFRTPPVAADVSLAEIPPEGQLSYEVAGKGSLWATFRLTAAPLESDLSAVTGNGLIVSRDYQVVRPEAGQYGQTDFRRGQVVKVTVTVVTAVPRFNMVLEDWLPAGFEAIDFNYKDADRALMAALVPDDDEYENEDGWVERYFYDHMESRLGGVAVFADYVDPGVYVYSYLVRPITLGSYSVPGPIVSEMYAPENFGRGEGQRMTVSQ